MIQATTMAAFPPAVHDLLALEGLLSPEERQLRDKVRSYMEANVAPVIADYWERAEFPHPLVPGFAALGLAGGAIKGYGCPGLSILSNAMAVVEIARVDASMSTFLLVHSYLAMLTIGLLGSEEQKQELLPRMAKFELVGCWALTEPSNGSDASALTATATKVPGGWMINGYKRWIGNGTWADVTVVWARNNQDGQVNAFIVRKGNPGLRTAKIENKIALRCVQNADMTFSQCFVPDSARLPEVTSFADTNKVLAISRIMVAWQPVGLSVGVYDMCCRYVTERKQFNTQLGSFQLVQEKLARMGGHIQGMWLACWRLSKLYEEGRMSHEQASLVKAWTSARGREVMALGRELLGGNGILGHFLVAKSFSDLEAIYTYEGTYEVNVLVAGRRITGVSAIRAASPPKGPQAGKKGAKQQQQEAEAERK
ncbi:hypothetical protein VOLCADRAFT_58804 [Volvox carteri f. nagariensis]|uniref:Acyl-CoA oxidase n=1 Tax=Volvox carteri f. nagariensis TaxID=3068 RepID=D8TRG6_VOLCA|nr:uncharacterized protein VOLCADRAFT_58804 [Volvox carteri f. nagariensis]EFJ49890.1 hypothetical protein VOLCADRAFT_58804 [Volvox carteri f. nagariensis]|eukprot:XP_002948955.1 hypothetical protein VOLCADRAFT_58804 [Volvox carteri f. nagariensis]